MHKALPGEMGGGLKGTHCSPSSSPKFCKGTPTVALLYVHGKGYEFA